jgi:hypothetical protein
VLQTRAQRAPRDNRTCPKGQQIWCQSAEGRRSIVGRRADFVRLACAEADVWGRSTQSLKD